MIAGPTSSRSQELKGPAQQQKNHGSSITSFWDNEIENAKYEPRAYWARARRDAQKHGDAEARGAKPGPDGMREDSERPRKRAPRK